jgi:hypothetical protein
MNAKHFFILLIIFVLAACATSRKVQVIQNALSKKDTTAYQIIAEKTSVDSSQIVKDIIEKIANTKFTFNTMNAKVKLVYETVNNTDAFIANISIDKGKSIFITVRGTMGVIGLKAIITKDSIVLFYPLNKKVELRPMSYIQELVKIPFTYNTIEDLIVGNPVFMEAAKLGSYKMNNNKLQVGMTGTIFKNLITLSEDNSKVLHIKLDDIDINQHRTCDITYSNHNEVLQSQFPLNRDIAIAAQSKLDIHMELKDYSFNDPLKYTFVVPKSGKKR